MPKQNQTSITAALLHASKGNDTPHEGILKAAKDRREHSVAALPQMNAKAVAIAAQIKELRLQQRAVAAGIARLEGDILVCDRLLAPIRQVPLDILPSLSSAILWDKLFLDIKKTDRSSLEQVECAAKEWFSRARARPLSLFVDWEGDTPSKPDVFRRFLNHLSPKIHHLGLGAWNLADLLRHFNTSTTWHWPNLQYLDLIEHRSWHADDEGELPPDIVMFNFDAADNLKQVSISYRFTSEHHAYRFLPWDSLTHIVLENWVRLEYWWDIFRWCSCLQAGQFFVDNFYLWDAPEPQPENMEQKYTHPDLEVLDLVLYCYDESAIGMTVPFTFRKLKSLCIHRSDEGSQARVMNWPRSSCVNSFDSLRILTLEDGWLCYDADYMVGILSEMVSLSELVVQSIYIVNIDSESDNYRNPKVFDAMTATNTNVILPRLTILRLSFNGDYIRDYVPVFQAMLLSRTQFLPPNCSRLEELEIALGYSESDEQLFKEDLASIEQQGFSIHWNNSTNGLVDKAPCNFRRPFQRP
ncbi:unnamed protein product [Cyclocybe aegerita]|uniref:Uncharacterized protein n=1 Tax=Cyclocybe aegerita TaxID=1973307 RepID=A0A8S0Y044_CYCAE|nr:unnamed protein product [Cyclocybe aegerita]